MCLQEPLMPHYEHPMQLFAFDYPEAWEAQYQEESGGVILVHASEACPGALSLTPMAIAATESPLDPEVLEAAERLELAIDPAALRRENRGDLALVYGEGARPQELLGGSVIRLWAVRKSRLLLRVVQL